MTTSRTGSIPPAPEPPAAATGVGAHAVRLSLAAAFYAGPLDGAWWPGSRDLQREARVLVDGFPSDRGRVHRLVVSAPDWDRTGTRVQTLRGPIRLGVFPRDDLHVVVLTLHDGTRLRLLVVAPATAPGVARSLMEQASAAGNRRDATTLLSAS